MCHDLVHHRTGHVDRNSEADTLVPAATPREDCCVDADQVAMQIYHGAPGVSWIDGCVGLNKVLIILDAEISTAAGRAHDTHGRGFAYRERISDRKNHIFLFEVSGITESESGQPRGLDLENGNIGF